MYNPVWFKRVYKNYVVDPIVRGDLGIQLPGGPIKLAVGGQFRRQDERVTMDAISNRANNPCTEIGVTDCDPTARGGVWLFDRQQTVFGGQANEFRPEARHYPAVAGFVETQLPLLESVDLNLAGRYEKFYSDVTDVDNDIFVPAAALKWQPLDWLGMRGSWGRTFSQVNPPRERDPIFGNSAGSTRYIGLGSGTLPDNSGPGDVRHVRLPERRDRAGEGRVLHRRLPAQRRQLHGERRLLRHRDQRLHAHDDRRQRRRHARLGNSRRPPHRRARC